MIDSRITLWALLSATACKGGEVGEPNTEVPDTAIVFADASTDDLLWAAYAALAGQSYDAYRAAVTTQVEATLSEVSGASCPETTSKGEVTTLTTESCTSPNGYEMDGTIALSGLPGAPGNVNALPHFAPFPPDVDFDMTFTGFSASGEGGRISLDGTYTQTVDGKQVVRNNELSASILRDGGTETSFTSSTEAVCDEALANCTITAGSWGEIVGVGTSQIDGTFGLDGNNDTTGTLQLKGTDLLDVGLEETGDLCWRFDLDGSEIGMLCADTTPILDAAPETPGGGDGTAKGTVQVDKTPAIAMKSGVAYTHRATKNLIITLVDFPEASCEGIASDWESVRPERANKLEVDSDAPDTVPSARLYSVTSTETPFRPIAPLKAALDPFNVDTTQTGRADGTVTLTDYPKAATVVGTVAFDVPYCGVKAPPLDEERPTE